MVAFCAVKFADVGWLTEPREIIHHSSENPEFVRNFMSQYILNLCALNMGVVQNNYKINNYRVLTVYNWFVYSVFHTCIHIGIRYIKLSKGSTKRLASLYFWWGKQISMVMSHSGYKCFIILKLYIGCWGCWGVFITNTSVWTTHA